jgi:hypothetical protein
MTVQELIDLLQSKSLMKAQVWYKEDFYGQPDREVEDFDIEFKDGRVYIGYTA